MANAINGRTHLPVRSTTYLAGLEEVRKRLGITQNEAGHRARLPRATWCRLVNGITRRGFTSARPTFDSLAAMADGVGMTFVLVPKDGSAPRSAPPPAAMAPTFAKRTRTGAGWEIVREGSEAAKRIMYRLRDARRAAGMSRKTMSKLAEINEHKLSTIEHGEREPRYGEVARYAEALGRVVIDCAPEAAPFANLTPESAVAARRLVVSYVDHLVRNGKPIPAGLTDAAEALDEGN